MSGNVALELIAEVMDWDEENNSPSAAEFVWLRMMSAIKYDGYADFRAGVRFLESLAVWLRQFEQADRNAAYEFFKKKLIYVSPAELKGLIEIFVPETVTPRLRRDVAQDLRIKPYDVWRTPDSARAFRDALRSTLFVGMSDGSRMDMLRRVNSGTLSPEQIVAALVIDDEKWIDLGEKLTEAIPGRKFGTVYLIDDFTGSGTTFARRIKGKWKGKLKKFHDRVLAAKDKLKDDFPLADNYTVHVHHYISSDQAREALQQGRLSVLNEWKDRTFGDIRITEGLVLPQEAKLAPEKDPDIWSLCDRYYDPGIDKRLEKHLEESGISTAKFGYAACALPLVLDHNTPNNSVPLLWAEPEGPAEGGHPMKALFRRRDRHW